MMSTTITTIFSQVWMMTLIVLTLYNYLQLRNRLFISSLLVLVVYSLSSMLQTFIGSFGFSQVNTDIQPLILAIPPLLTAAGLYWINQKDINFAMLTALILLLLESLALLTAHFDSSLLTTELKLTMPPIGYKPLLQLSLLQIFMLGNHIALLFAFVMPSRTIRTSLSFEDIIVLFEAVDSYVQQQPESISKRDATRHLQAAAMLIYDFNNDGVNKQYARCALTLINHVITLTGYKK